MINFFTQLLDLIYRKKCYFCSNSKDNALMCEKCFKKIKYLSAKILRVIDTVPAFSACIYENDVKKLIRAIKYHNQKELAFYQAKLMYEYWQKLPESVEDYTIIPVPLYKNREKKRRYNQMNLVAQEFAKLTGFKINNNLIFRTKDTKPQYKLTKKEREKNLHNAFQVFKENYNNEKLLLIDDILTTGSTMEEMVKTFRNAEIKDLTIFVTSCTKYNVI